MSLIRAFFHGFDANLLMLRSLGLPGSPCESGLSLARNRLTDDGVEALAKAMPGGCDRRLRRLDHWGR